MQATQKEIFSFHTIERNVIHYSFLYGLLLQHSYFDLRNSWESYVIPTLEEPKSIDEGQSTAYSQ